MHDLCKKLQCAGVFILLGLAAKKLIQTGQLLKAEVQILEIIPVPLR